MSDFHQNGVITTRHRLGADNLDTLERDLEKTAALRPVVLVLPCLAAELDAPAPTSCSRACLSPISAWRGRSWRATRAMR